MILMKEFVSLTTVAMEIGKRHFFNDQWKILQEEKCFIKNISLTDANYHWKNLVDWILDTWWDKTLQPQKCTFSEKESKKLKNITILHFMTTLNNVTFKIETSFELQGYLRSL